MKSYFEHYILLTVISKFFLYFESRCLGMGNPSLT